MAKNYSIPPEPDTETERIQRWRWMLEQDVPIIGGWMHRRIASALIDSALSGNWLAAQSLAMVFAFHQEAEVRKMAGETLRKINYATGIDAVWGVWAETRHPGLEKIALSYHRIAGQPASVRLISALRSSLERPEALSTITNGSADLVTPLIQACGDRDARIAGQARQAILSLHNQASIDAVCQAWQSGRSRFLADIMDRAGYIAQKPASTRVLSALKDNRLEAILHGSADLVAPLLEACEDADEEIAARARQCLPQLQSPATVDAFCRLWSETRSPLLEKNLLEAGYTARGPVEVRLLATLKTGHLNIAEKVKPHGLRFLLHATQDMDETIRQNARAALANLHDEESRDALCSLVIEAGDLAPAEADTAKEIALSSRYAPRTSELRALFYFLTDQWQAYDELDFDQSMMRAVYEASKASLRQHIAAHVQAAGRTDYLTILAGVDYRSRADEVNPGEAALMIRVLGQNQEYARLWSLVSELALPFSLEIIHILAASDWRPAEDMERQLFEALVQLAGQPIDLTDKALAHTLPPAIPRATLKVRGRINEVAFSPGQPVLAIATSQRKVVLWNFQAARIERILGDFQHSVGKVNFTPRGTLVCAERTSADALCAVTVHDAEESYQLWAHEGTVTVLEPVGDDRLLTAGRDGHAFLWDLAAKKKIAEKDYGFWPRSAAISPDRQYAALLYNRLGLVRLPELTIVPGYPFLAPHADGFHPGVAQNAGFSPDGKFLLAGQYNGQVGLYFHTSLTQRPRKAVVTQHSKPVRGIYFLPDHPLVVTAGAEGQVRFVQWPEMKLQGTVYSPEGQLTSLRVSQKGDFMATGSNDASLVLWDLRVLDIPNLFTQPLATATHDQISTVLALGEYHTLPEPVRNGLKFLKLLLQYRFRFDIQVEEAPIIRFGEFDIILDEA